MKISPDRFPSKAAAITFLLLLPLCCSADAADDWPAFRGAGSRGVATGYDTPEQWDATDVNDASVLWKTSVPGLGHSCPVIVGDQIFVLTAVPEEGTAELQIGRGGNINAAKDNGTQSWLVLCYDKTTGEERWRRTACTGIPKATRHTKATHANTTVAVEGDNVVAFFGSEGLYCYGLDGNLKWKKDLGIVDISKYGTGWGYASSPSIHDGIITLVCDDPDNPYIVAIRLEDGEEVWRRSRKDDCERSWGTPLIHQSDDATQVVVNGWPWIVSYDLASGNEVWRIRGGGDNPIPSPFVADNRIFITNSHGGQSPIIAIRPDAQGNLSEVESAEDAGLIWRTERGGAYMPTPVVVGDYLYVGDTRGVMRCFQAASGKKVYEERLPGGAYLVASLVASEDRIYCPAEDGTVFVIATGPQFEVLSKSQLGEPCLASPAISQGVLYFRTTKSLIAIGSKGQRRDVSATKEQDGNATKSTDSDKPNILFIAVDDLRPTLGCYGDETAITPHIDRLANRGMRFNRAYCQVAVCNPSRASLMTGLRPDTLGVWTLPIHFREAMPDAVTLPQWLRKSGYAAVSHGKIYHNPTPDPQSWSEPIRANPKLPYFYPDGTRERIREQMQKLPQKDWRKNNLRGPATAAPDLPDNRLIDGARTDMCIEDLRRLSKSDSPFFLAMGYIRPHLSFVAPRKYWDLYDPEKLPVLSDERMPEAAPPYALGNNSEVSHYVDMMDMPKPWDTSEVSPRQARQLVHGYHACVSYIDAQIGRLLTALDEEGLRENTIVVLWSDHGWKLGEYRGWGKMSNYEIDTRVPLIISAPSMKSTAGESTESLAELLDIFPTLCDLADVEQPDFVEGSSLVPVLKDAQAEVHEAAVSQYYRRHEGSEYMGYALRTNEYRYVEWRNFATGETTAQELYQHTGRSASALGHRESVNLAPTADQALLKELSKLLQKTHPRRELTLTPPVHTNPSGSNRLSVRCTFENAYSGDVTVYNIKPSGSRAKGVRLSPGKRAAYKARLGGVFVVESRDGLIHEIHSPSWPASTIVIGPQATSEQSITSELQTQAEK